MKIKSTKIPYKPELVDEEEARQELLYENLRKDLDDQGLLKSLIDKQRNRSVLGNLIDYMKSDNDVALKGSEFDDYLGRYKSDTLNELDRRIKKRQPIIQALKRKYDEYDDLPETDIHPNFEDYDFEKGEFNSDILSMNDTGKRWVGGERFDRLRKKLKMKK